MKEPKRGNLLVRTGKRAWQPTAVIGKIVRCNGNSYKTAFYGNYSELHDGDYRYATKEEEAAYRAGNKHVDLVVKSVDNFSII